MNIIQIGVSRARSHSEGIVSFFPTWHSLTSILNKYTAKVDCLYLPRKAKKGTVEDNVHQPAKVKKALFLITGVE
jgi:hypothetical protein